MRLLAAYLVVLTSPASAQLVASHGGYGPYAPGEVRVPEGWGRDLGEVRERIDDGRDSRRLSRREARRLSRGANAIESLADRYATGGLSASERRELYTRTAVLRDQVDARRLGVPVPPRR